MKDELSKMADVLREQNLEGDRWAKYMGIKSHLLKRQFLFMMDPAVYRSLNKLQPLVRIRNGKVVWHGVEDGDFLSKVSILDMEYLNNPEKHGFQPRKVYGLRKVAEISVWFPSESANVFVPSAVQVLQQIPEKIDVNNLLFEIRLGSENVSEVYDSVLKCHQATVILYRLILSRSLPLERAQQRELPDCEPKKDQKGLNDIKVKSPQGPKRRTPIPSR